MLPPQWGIGLEWKISRLFSRKSRIQAGSFFISEIWRTIVSSSPRRALKTNFESVRKSYLLISPIASVGVFANSVDMAFRLSFVSCARVTAGRFARAALLGVRRRRRLL